MFWALSSLLLSLSIMWAGVKACFPSLVMFPLLQMIHLVGQACTFSPISLGLLPRAGDLGDCPPELGFR